MFGSPGRARTADPVINSHLLYRLSYRGKDISSLTLFCFIRKNGAPGEIRTPDHLVRSQVLYPTELRARCGTSNYVHFMARCQPDIRPKNKTKKHFNACNKLTFHKRPIHNPTNL